MALAILLFLSFNVYSKSIDGFFEDFDPQDISIVAGGSLKVLSAAVLDVQSGATFNVSGDLTVDTNSGTAFQVQDGSANSFFLVDTSASNATVTIYEIGQATNKIWEAVADTAAPAITWHDGSGNTVMTADLDATTFNFETQTDSSTGFTVKDTDSAAIFTVDTAGGGILVESDDGTNLLSVADAVTSFQAQTDAAAWFKVIDASNIPIFTVDTAAGGILVESDNGVDLLTVTDATMTVVDASNSTTTFMVKNAASTTALQVDATKLSLQVGTDLTIGSNSGGPTIYTGTGSVLNIFAPTDGNHANTLTIQGDMSLSGDLFNPAIFDMQSSLSNVEAAVSEKIQKIEMLQSQLSSVNRDLSSIKEVSLLSPKVLGFAQKALERNLGEGELERLISGHEISADSLHTHEVFPKDVIFNKDIYVKGQRPNVRGLANHEKVLTFKHESAAPMISASGMSRLVDGAIIIDLDPEFIDLAAFSDEMPYLIQLTPIGQFSDLYVSAVGESSFTITVNGSENLDAQFFWRVEAFQRDSQGKYIQPEVYQNVRNQKN